MNFNGADLRVQTAKLPNGTVYESPVRFVESKFGDTDLSRRAGGSPGRGEANLAGVKADKSPAGDDGVVARPSPNPLPIPTTIRCRNPAFYDPLLLLAAAMSATVRRQSFWRRIWAKEGLSMERTELLRILEAHRLWLRNDRRGHRADLTLTTLRREDLKGRLSCRAPS